MLPSHRTRPSPWHVPHGVNCSPVPLQVGQVATCWNMPSGVRTAWTTWPAPLHVVQVLDVVPAFTPLPLHVLQSSSRLTSISLLQAWAQQQCSTAVAVVLSWQRCHAVQVCTDSSRADHHAGYQAA